MNFTFADALTITGGRFGCHDAPCPFCSAFHNPRRKVFRIWQDDTGFAGYNCARCGESGWVRDGETAVRPPPERIEAILREAEDRQNAETMLQLGKARWFWKCSVLLPGTPADNYLRQVRGYRGPIPATLRFLPPSRPEHHPAMIAAFGFASEPEPAVLAIDEEKVAGVRVTLLSADGRGKAGTDRDKIMLGRSAGSPIVLAPPNDSLGLVITEGIEDAVSAHQATGLGAWAAGAASRLPALAEAVPEWIDCITVLADEDEAGQKNSAALASCLRSRGLTVEMVTFDRQEVAA